MRVASAPTVGNGEHSPMETEKEQSEKGENKETGVRQLGISDFKRFL